jgi:hypothetical protein
MSKETHIEDLFHDGLSDFQTSPPKSGWNNIQTSLNNLHLEHIAKVKLGNNIVSPAKAVWQKIVTKLWWSNFAHFSLLKFNLYHAIVGIVGISSLAVVTSLPKKEIYVPEKSINITELKSSETYTLEETLPLMDFLKANNISTNNQISSPELNPKNTQTSVVLNTKNESEFIAEHSSFNPYCHVTIKLTENIIDLNNSPSNKKSESNNKITKLPSLFSNLVPIHFLLTQDNLYWFTHISDTLGIDFKGEPIVKKLKFIEEGWYAGIIMFQQDFEFLNSEVQDIYSKNDEYSEFSYKFGLRFNLVNKNLLLQSGIYFSNINNCFQHTQNQLIIHDETPHLPFIEYSWPYVSDTIIEQTTHKYNNSYTYVELPILIGTHLESEHFATNIKTGPVINFLTQTNSTLVVQSDNDFISVSKSNFKRPGLRWEISADLIYKFNDKLSIYIEPSYVHDITSLLKNDYEVKCRFKGFTAGMGIYYRF